MLNDTYQNNITSGEILLSNDIKIGSTNIINGNIKGLNTPNILDPDTSIVINKKYIDNNYILPYEPNKSIQFVNNGTQNLIIDDTTDVKKIKINGSIISGSAYLTNDQINLINDPIDEYDAATKQYVDNINKKNINNIINSNGVTYTVSQFINSIIIRNGLPNDITTDYLPNTSTVLALNRKPFTFNIFNNNVNSLSALKILPSDSNTTIIPSDNIIYGNYQLSAKCIINSNDTITFIVLNNSLINFKDFISPGLNFNDIPLNITQTPTVNNIRLKNIILEPISPIYLLYNKSIQITYTNILNKIIFRGPSSNVTDTFDISDATDDNKLGFEFVIMNISDYTLTYKYKNNIIGNILPNMNGLFLYNSNDILLLSILSRS